jgi:hypothetical protein
MEKIDIPKEVEKQVKSSQIDTSKTVGLGDVPNFFSK